MILYVKKNTKNAHKTDKKQNFQNLKKTFLLMFQGTLMQKIRFLGKKLWPVAREQKETGHT